MSVNKKHLATLLLGAAAGIAAYKYYNMTPEEREKLAADLKDKANKLKTEAEAGVDKAKEYFDELKTKGSEAFNEYGGDIGGFLKNFLGDKSGKDKMADDDMPHSANTMA